MVDSAVMDNGRVWQGEIRRGTWGLRHMTWEYQTALPYLGSRGILSSHDVLVAHSVRQLFRRNAFPTFCDREGLRWRTFQNSGFAMVDRSPGSRGEAAPGLLPLSTRHFDIREPYGAMARSLPVTSRTP